PCRTHDQWVPPAHHRLASKSSLDWVGPASIRHQTAETLGREAIGDDVLEEIRLDPSKWRVSIVHANPYTNLEEASMKTDANLKRSITDWKPLDLEQSQTTAFADKRLSYVYRYREAAFSRANQSVTQLKLAYDINRE